MNNCCAEKVLRTSSRHVSKASSRRLEDQRLFVGNDLSAENYAVGNEIIYCTEVLKLDFCDYILHAYILLRGDITIMGQNNATQVAFEDCAPFIKSIPKIDETAIDDAEDLDLVMPMYNLLKCSWNYFNTTGS